MQPSDIVMDESIIQNIEIFLLDRNLRREKIHDLQRQLKNLIDEVNFLKSSSNHAKHDELDHTRCPSPLNPPSHDAIGTPSTWNYGEKSLHLNAWVVYGINFGTDPRTGLISPMG
uniref:Uncharacterized protein n=1 Tax=Eutreptiella gymnastica TaxID=73025 RepID=A0A7S1JHE5_9EUGL|mmetsp:Transcript_98297/g.169378  ORF Transcript_98297/g.169378 Transcript_98297/m.169378 type:complete len:115 (+) Transcript_98297:215-559(+)